MTLTLIAGCDCTWLMHSLDRVLLSPLHTAFDGRKSLCVGFIGSRESSSSSLDLLFSALDLCPMFLYFCGSHNSSICCWELLVPMSLQDLPTLGRLRMVTALATLVTNVPLLAGLEGCSQTVLLDAPAPDTESAPSLRILSTSLSQRHWVSTTTQKNYCVDHIRRE